MVQVDHMLGIPGDTIELQEESALFYNRTRPDLITIYWLTYYPKTRIVETAERMGLITEQDIDSIETGKRLTEESYMTQGSVRNPKPYYSIAFLFNYLPILPRWMVTLLVKSRLYRVFRIKNFYIATVLPRFIRMLFNRKDYRARTHIVRLLDKMFLSKLRKSS